MRDAEGSLEPGLPLARHTAPSSQGLAGRGSGFVFLCRLVVVDSGLKWCPLASPAVPGGSGYSSQVSLAPAHGWYDASLSQSRTVTLWRERSYTLYTPSTRHLCCRLELSSITMSVKVGLSLSVTCRRLVARLRVAKLPLTSSCLATVACAAPAHSNPIYTADSNCPNASNLGYKHT